MTKSEMIRELILHSNFKHGEDRGCVFRRANSRKKENIANCYESYSKGEVSADYALSVLTGIFPPKVL